MDDGLTVGYCLAGASQAAGIQSNRHKQMSMQACAGGLPPQLSSAAIVLAELHEAATIANISALSGSHFGHQLPGSPRRGVAMRRHSMPAQNRHQVT
jgi:hypothetical protein